MDLLTNAGRKKHLRGGAVLRILFINPNRPLCGIAQFGLRVYNALKAHLHEFGDYEIHYQELYADVEEYQAVVDRLQPDLILYSFNDTAIPFLHQGGRFIVKDLYPDICHILVCHEQEQVMVDNPNMRWDWFGSAGVDAWAGHDPTLVIPKGNNCIFSATRPVLRSEWIPEPEIPTFGSSTFGFPNKGHVRIVQAIQAEYNEAVIRFNMPPSIYGDPNLNLARSTANQCRAILKPGIRLEVTHDMLETEEQLIGFLYGNSVNVFDYDQNEVPHSMRGVASSPDSALSTRRPLIVTNCTMFRHLYPIFGRYPLDGSIKQLIERQKESRSPQFVYNEWSGQRMAGEYHRIIRRVVNNGKV